MEDEQECVVCGTDHWSTDHEPILRGSLVDIYLDVNADAHASGRCCCQVCLTGYRTEYDEAAEVVAKRLGIEIRVRTWRYDSPAEGPCQDTIWQRIHNECDWDETHDD